MQSNSKKIVKNKIRVDFMKLRGLYEALPQNSVGTIVRRLAAKDRKICNQTVINCFIQYKVSGLYDREIIAEAINILNEHGYNKTLADYELPEPSKN